MNDTALYMLAGIGALTCVCAVIGVIIIGISITKPMTPEELSVYLKDRRDRY